MEPKRKYISKYTWISKGREAGRSCCSSRRVVPRIQGPGPLQGIDNEETVVRRKVGAGWKKVWTGRRKVRGSTTYPIR